MKAKFVMYLTLIAYSLAPARLLRLGLLLAMIKMKKVDH